MGNRQRLWLKVSLLALIVACPARIVSAQTTAPAEAAPIQKESPAEAAKPEPAVPTLFGNVWRDLRGVIRRDSLTWIAAGGVVSAGAVLLDDEVAKALHDPEPDLSVEIGDVLGEAYVHVGVPLAIYVTSRMTHHDAPARVASTLLRAQFVNGIMTRSLKLLPRHRPDRETLSLSSGSFPSGHTSAAFATATVLQRQYGWRAGLPAYLVASYVGVTRLQNEHFLSDVTFGAALGVASALSVDVPSTRVSVSPLVRPGTIGMMVEVR